MNHEYVYEYLKRKQILLNESMMKIIYFNLLLTLFLVIDDVSMIMDVDGCQVKERRIFNVN